jgi:hypothetical protein
MGPSLIVLAAVLLLIDALSGASGLCGASSMLMLALPMFGFIYVILTFYRVSRAAR